MTANCVVKFKNGEEYFTKYFYQAMFVASMSRGARLFVNGEEVSVRK